MARAFVGTSGWAYASWKPKFYPPEVKTAGFLRHYATRLPTTEVNYTFRHLPTEKTAAAWLEATPPGFVFALKASERITHVKRLREPAETLPLFLERAALIGERLGPILFQTPPTLKRDDDRLAAFLASLPSEQRFALEVRHPSWHTEEIYSLLRRHQTALCLAETDKDSPPEITTADFVYARLRRPSYTAQELAAWKERCQAWQQQGLDVYIFFKHEEAGQAPAYARRLLAS